jgi:hypothetical protein
MRFVMWLKIKADTGIYYNRVSRDTCNSSIHFPEFSRKSSLLIFCKKYHHQNPNIKKCLMQSWREFSTNVPYATITVYSSKAKEEKPRLELI